jgi:hypothetical protein
MNRLFITLAAALLPPSRRAWGQAMKAEYAALSDGQSAFALGCLGASLRENVTTGEGWARMGFGLVLAMAVLLGSMCVGGLATIVLYPTKHLFLTLTSLLTTLGFLAIIILIARATLSAMEAPTNRYHLAEIGSKTAPWLLVIVGLATAVAFSSLTYAHAVLMPQWLGIDAVNFSLFNTAICSIVLLAVGFVSRKSAQAMFNFGLIGAAIITVSSLWTNDLGLAMLDGYYEAALQHALLLLLFALAGAILMWMERPTKAVR